MTKHVKLKEERRKNRVRMNVRNKGKPRLSVFRSGKYIYAQIIDDSIHSTLASASSKETEAGSLSSKSNCQAAEWVGKKVAERGLSSGVTKVIFDRGSYRFHGRVKALADGAREAGLVF